MIGCSVYAPDSMATHCEQTQVSNNKLLPNTVTDRMRCSVNQGDLKVQPFLLWIEKIHLGSSGSLSRSYNP